MENEAITPESVAAAVEAAKAAQAAEAPAEEVKVEEPAVEVAPEAAPEVVPEVTEEVKEEAPTPEVSEVVPEAVEASTPDGDILNSEEITNILKEEGVTPEEPAEVQTEEPVPEIAIDVAPKKDSYQDKIEKIELKISKHKADIEELEAQKELLIKEQLATDVKGKIDSLSLEELEKLKDELK